MEIRIDSLAAGGDGVGRDEGGRVVFVPLTAPGDRVRVRIVEGRKRFARAELVEVLEASDDRVDPPCKAFGRCGGCAWQHLAYPAQVSAKGAIVADALRRIGRFDVAPSVPTTASPEAYGYRVRTRLVQQGTRLGYRMQRSHSICVVDTCPVLDPRLQAVLGVDRDPSSPASSASGQEWEAAVGSAGKVRAQRTDVPGAAVDQRVGEDLLRISHGVFAQANGLLVEPLVQAVHGHAAPRGRTQVSCVELYSGAGLFTMGLSRRFDQVWAVESHPGAVVDLRFNLERAGRSNVRVEEGSVESVLPRLGVSGPDLLVLDPPRAGVSPEALQSILALAPHRIVYVSCDPATLARDLARLRDDGYRLVHVEAFDLFPQTPHVESLATLERARP